MDRETESKDLRMRRSPKLTPKEQDELCERYARGDESVKDLAAAYNIAIRTLYNIVERKRHQLEEAKA